MAEDSNCGTHLILHTVWLWWAIWPYLCYAAVKVQAFGWMKQLWVIMRYDACAGRGVTVGVWDFTSWCTNVVLFSESSYSWNLREDEGGKKCQPSGYRVWAKKHKSDNHLTLWYFNFVGAFFLKPQRSKFFRASHKTQHF